MRTTDVVAAVIKKDDCYLLAKRNKDKYMGLKWEFPGGKVETNETFEEALSREILEELNVNIEIHNKVAEEKYQDSEINIILHYFMSHTGMTHYVNHPKMGLTTHNNP